jgi:hypothetical protein
LESREVLFGKQEETSKRGSIKLVRGCPCFKVFGDEKLCINDDSILEVDAMEVDPQVFAYRANRQGMLEEQAEDGNVCYTSIYVNYPDNKVYCISQGWVLRIHGYDVPGNDLEDALQFLSTKDLAASAEICSECLYKFILTLADTFSDMISRKEKTEEIKSYVDKFSLKIAVKHSQTDGLMSPIGTEDEIDEGVDHFAFLRGYLVQLLEQQTSWSELLSEVKEDGSPRWLVDLVSMRELLARFEFQFYSQTLQLRDINDFHLLVKMLQFILKTSDQILDVNDRIHSEIRSGRFQELSETDSRLKNLECYGEKSRTVEHNFGNILQILSRL